jgi:hypothetical protein
MRDSDVFPAEMPEEPSRTVPPRVAPLDADTAERLLSGRLDPDDAPPGYAEVAGLLQAAAGPADETELAGEAAALSKFHEARRGPLEAGGRARLEPPGSRATAGGRGGVRGRLVALALAGAVVVGGVGVWTAGGGPFSGELRSPSGGPAAGGSGSGAPASRGYGRGAGGAGSLRPAGPGLGPTAGTAQVADGRPPSLPSAREPATARHGGDVTSRGGGPRLGAKPNRPAKQPKPKPEKSGPKEAKEPNQREAKEPKQEAKRPKAPGPRNAPH